MKKLFLSVLLFFILATLGFSQNKNSRIDFFLGLSSNTIQQIWGYPERTEINSEGYVLWYYTYEYAERIFYFDGNYVEMSQSILVVNSYDYAKQLADDVDTFFASEGFWIVSQQQNRVIFTNGMVNIVAQVTLYNKSYIFQLLAYR